VQNGITACTQTAREVPKTETEYQDSVLDHLCIVIRMKHQQPGSRIDFSERARFAPPSREPPPPTQNATVPAKSALGS
jgi:hypothetical protein